MNQLFCLPCRSPWSISALLSGLFLLATLVTVRAETPSNVVLLVGDAPREEADPVSSQPQGMKPLGGLLDDWWAPAGMR